MKFPKGQPKIGGRKKGSVNVLTASVKAALALAFDELGGVPALVKWGRKNPTHFYALWGKLIPLEVKNADGETFRVEVAEVVVRSRQEAAALLPPPESPP